jgi:hypothetical protein
MNMLELPNACTMLLLILVDTTILHACFCSSRWDGWYDFWGLVGCHGFVSGAFSSYFAKRPSSSAELTNSPNQAAKLSIYLSAYLPYQSSSRYARFACDDDKGPAAVFLC